VERALAAVAISSAWPSAASDALALAKIVLLTRTGDIQEHRFAVKHAWAVEAINAGLAQFDLQVDRFDGSLRQCTTGTALPRLSTGRTLP
jgi:hypothetical protein